MQPSPTTKWKSRIYDILNENGSRKFIYLVISNVQNNFVKNHSDCTQKYPEKYFKKILKFLIDNIYFVFENQVSQKFQGVPIVFHC